MVKNIISALDVFSSLLTENLLEHRQRTIFNGQHNHKVPSTTTYHISTYAACMGTLLLLMFRQLQNKIHNDIHIPEVTTIIYDIIDHMIDHVAHLFPWYSLLALLTFYREQLATSKMSL